MNKDTLKKHHFWILIGLIPLLVLIAFVVITSEVGAAIEQKVAAVAKTKAELATKQSPKPNDGITKLDKQKEELEKKQTALWKENWERQIGQAAGAQGPPKNLFRWPTSTKLARFNYTADYATNPDQLKFGAAIPDTTGEPNEFKKAEVYLAEFTNPRPGSPGTGMADIVAPTTFSGGWDKVLRHVSFPNTGTGTAGGTGGAFAGPGGAGGATGAAGWGDRQPTSEQLWLALEDIWVQRALLGQIKLVNDQIGAFAQVPLNDANNRPVTAPLERAFESRVWRVEIKAAPRPSDGRYVMTGTLKNLTDRLQLLGNGNNMTLNVWLSDDPNAQPFGFKIGGEFVPGGAALKILQTDDHVLPVGTTPSKLARVEQVFDTRTVPVRRIERVALGYRDSRHAAVELLTPKFKVYEEEAAKLAAAAAAPAAGPGGAMPGPAGVPMGIGGAGGSTAGVAEGGGPVDSVLDGNKKRYVQVTDAVRRMPVALCVLVDQAYVQDILMAYANSPLRFQITQTHWQRFRGTLGGLGTTGGSVSGGPDDVFAPVARGVEGTGFTPGGGGGLRPLPGFRPGGVGLPGPMGVPPVGPMGAGTPFGGGGSLTSVTESQLTSGLVELTVYGIVSLYEKFPAETTGTAMTKQP